ncbi:hypothetical protein RsoM2USA_206 [Ralstonia phage RsoM2USA]|nr:hypothetical protein RsoM2USA_206 [Ralstonia phage RsoM2USA]
MKSRSTAHDQRIHDTNNHLFQDFVIIIIQDFGFLNRLLFHDPRIVGINKVDNHGSGGTRTTFKKFQENLMREEWHNVVAKIQILQLDAVNFQVFHDNLRSLNFDGASNCNLKTHFAKLVDDLICQATRKDILSSNFPRPSLSSICIDRKLESGTFKIVLFFTLIRARLHMCFGNKNHVRKFLGHHILRVTLSIEKLYHGFPKCTHYYAYHQVVNLSAINNSAKTYGETHGKEVPTTAC